MFKKKDTKQDETQNWYKDRYQRAAVSRNILVVVSFACLVVCMFGAGLVYMLLPYKTVEPFVIQIDQKSGITEVVEPVSAAQMQANEALAKYFIVKYIRSRESFIQGGWQEPYNYYNYQTVINMSAPSSQAIDSYNKIINVANKESYIARFSDPQVKNAARTVKIKSIQLSQFNDSQKATIRVLVEEAGVAGARNTHGIIEIEYSFVNAKLTNEQLYINPLGFFVTTYRNIEEVVSDEKE